MNKVITVNLGGYPFTIDEDAYEHLNTYLKTIHRHFQASEGYDEITTDIEARLAELFQENLNGRPIVSLDNVKAAITVMGTPEEFGAEPIEETKESSESHIKTGKRLFRHPEDEMIGGVCAGIASYFGIQDPLWVRIGFIVLACTVGFGIPLYIILWAIVPKAETASDRLAMRGEPINVSNIGKLIESEVNHFSERFSTLGEDISEEWRSKKKPTREQRQIMSEEPLPKGFMF